ncbi:NAD(P)-binding domain-containing protein [Mesorhizobium sp. M0571]|uniref:NAD(P)-binding domain-containing protein n=1 Tax=Mesorhizobium sp. M0571 TaxID=2956960 RepID=UPI00333BC58C
MAANLLKAGHDVTVYNRTHSKVEATVCWPSQFAAENNKETAMDCNLELLWIPSTSAGVIISICLAGTVATATAQGTVATIVADQVRSQGFACKNPSSAERIEAESTPNQTVYLLQCEGITYHVLLIPDQAADVAKVD